MYIYYLFCFYGSVIFQVYLLLKQINSMNKQDAQSSTKTFQAHLDALIQSIRFRQDYFLTLLDHIHQLISNKHQIQNNLYIHEQINRYNGFLSMIQGKQMQVIDNYNAILKKYQRNQTQYEDHHLFLKRVTFRILEIMFHNINLMTNKIPNLFQEYMKFKLMCQKLLCQESKDKPYKIMRLILEYEHQKISKYTKILIKMVNYLQNGDYKSLQKIQQYFSKIQLRVEIIDFNNVSQETQKQKKLNTFQLLKKNRLLQKQKLNAQKEQILLSKMEQNRINKELQYTNTIKIKKYVDNFKDIMEINRQDMFDICNSDKNQQHIFKDLMNKNRNNQRYIQDFIKVYKYKQKKRLIRQQKCDSQSNNINLNKNNKSHQPKPPSLLTNRQPNTNRKSLLLKVKQNQLNVHVIQPEIIYNSNLQCTIHNDMLLNQNIIENELINQNVRRSEIFNRPFKTNQRKFRLKSSIKNEQKQKNKIIDHINNIIEENELMALKLKNQNLAENEQKLPQLNKRALSTDQHYKVQQNTISMQVLHLANSLKTSNEFNHKKYKFEKTQFYPKKIKLELKHNNIPLYVQNSKKPFKLNQNSKKLYF